MHSGLFWIKNGQFETAQWLFHYEKWTNWNCILVSFTMKSRQTDTAKWHILHKNWIIWNCTVVISLWKMNNPNFHIGFSHNENWTNWYCTVGYFTKKGIILNCTVAIYFIMKSKKSEITQSEKKKKNLNFKKNQNYKKTFF